MSRAPNNDHEFDSLLSWRDPVTPARLSRAAIASIVFHLIVLAVYLVLPKSDYKFRDSVRVQFEARESVKIYAPRPHELTQKDANKGKVTHELDVRAAF